MKIIAHRGIWENNEEKNSKNAFEKALEYNFGIELDLRFLNGKIYISHDHLGCYESIYLFEDFIKQTYRNNKQTLAINIKEDGIAFELYRILNKYNVRDYFAFDMSYPENIVYKKNNIRVFSRLSEYETNNITKSRSKGYWVDFFHEETCYGDFLNDDILKYELAFVSPELHQNNPYKLWNYIKDNLEYLNNDISLCTDLPFEAKTFFGVL